MSLKPVAMSEAWMSSGGSCGKMAGEKPWYSWKAGTGTRTYTIGNNGIAAICRGRATCNLYIAGLAVSLGCGNHEEDDDAVEKKRQREEALRHGPWPLDVHGSLPVVVR